MLPLRKWCCGVGSGGGTNRSLILGGGAFVGGPILRIVSLLSSILVWGRPRRSGELLPCWRLERGARAGIREGVVPVAFAVGLPTGLRLIVSWATGVLDLGGGGARMTLLPRLGGADF
jgi:hypothetical protein